MKALNLSKQIILATEVHKAESFFKRLKGLIGTADMKQGTGLLINPCSSIHTCFMRYSIDVVFLDEENTIVHILHSIPPYRFSPIIKGAVKVLELPAGVCAFTNTVIGDKIQFIHREG